MSKHIAEYHNIHQGALYKNTSKTQKKVFHSPIKMFFDATMVER